MSLDDPAKQYSVSEHETASRSEAGSKMLIVRDNFFREDLAALIDKGTMTYQWSYHHKSDMADPAHNKFFVSYLWNDSLEENFFSTLWRLIRKGIPSVASYRCWRIIANGQVRGQNGNWHTDHGDRTVLYFPLKWVPEWGGSAFFKDGDAETEIQYEQNRIVAFDSSILHYGSAPTMDNILRVSIAFNLRANQEVKCDNG